MVSNVLGILGTTLAFMSQFLRYPGQGPAKFLFRLYPVIHGYNNIHNLAAYFFRFDTLAWSGCCSCCCCAAMKVAVGDEQVKFYLELLHAEL